VLLNKALAGSDLNLVVGKDVAHAGNLELWHVTTDAVTRASAAGWRRRLLIRRGSAICQRVCGPCRFSLMTAKALRVICRRIALQWLVGIVAGDAGEAFVTIAPAPALFQSECREPNGFNVSKVRNVPPSAMAGAAEVNRLN